MSSDARVRAAEMALRDFGADRREAAAVILPFWRHYAGLSERERLAVLDRFDAQPWPGCITSAARRAAGAVPPAPAAGNPAPGRCGQRGAAGQAAGGGRSVAVGAAVSEGCAAAPTNTSTGADGP